MGNTNQPDKMLAYRKALDSGLLDRNIEKAYARLDSCDLCPRGCGVNRLQEEKGVCNTGKQAVVASYMPHFGEEKPLVLNNGSGTLFIANCNMLCNFCQNFDISHEGDGHEVTDDQLAFMMLELQRAGCLNINIVSPTHVVPQLLGSLKIAAEKGLSIPLVYNTGGYDAVSTLKLLDGIVDIYMADFKFWDNEISEKCCGITDYKEVVTKALIEMHRQVGVLTVDERGAAVKGVIVRHLVLPDNLAGTPQVMKFISKKISPDTYVNIMGQYRPCGKAYEIKELAKSLSVKAFHQALSDAETAGLTHYQK